MNDRSSHPKGPASREDALRQREGSPETSRRIAGLSDRQICYLRHVFDHRNSKEIAQLTGVSPRAVDKQLTKAINTLGAKNRIDAARILAGTETGVEPSPPANIPPSDTPSSLFPMPVPTTGAAANLLTWKQAAIWVAIIAVVTPIGLTVAGMVILTLTFLFGDKAG